MDRGDGDECKEPYLSQPSNGRETGGGPIRTHRRGEARIGDGQPENRSKRRIRGRFHSGLVYYTGSHYTIRL